MLFCKHKCRVCCQDDIKPDMCACFSIEKFFIHGKPLLLRNFLIKVLNICIFYISLQILILFHEDIPCCYLFGHFLCLM